MKNKLKENTTTAMISVPETSLVKKKGFSTMQQIYDYYLENVKKDKNGNFLIKYENKKLINKDFNLLYETFSKKITETKRLKLKESEIFKPLRVKERLKDKKIEFDSKCIFNHSKKQLVYNGNVLKEEYDILLNFYDNYTIDVGGYVILNGLGLFSIDVKFGKITKDFYLASNRLTSFKNCPKEIGRDFDCSYNKLISLEHCPKMVKGNFYCNDNLKKFTIEEIREKCKVGGKISI